MKQALVQNIKNKLLVARSWCMQVPTHFVAFKCAVAHRTRHALALSRTKSEQILLALLCHQLSQNTRIVALEFSSGGVGGLNY